MFNLTAFISAVIFLVLLALVYTGALFYLYHTWRPARIGGVVIGGVSFALLVSHFVWLLTRAG
jgi:hypothetical protein